MMSKATEIELLYFTLIRLFKKIVLLIIDQSVLVEMTLNII